MDFLATVNQTLASTEASLRAALHGLDREALTVSPAPNEWPIVVVLCHLRDLEQDVFPQRVELIRRNDGSRLPLFDESGTVEARGYAKDDPLRALEAFCAARRKNLPLAAGLRADELESTGQHEEFGPLTLRALLADWAGSDLVHTAQIQRIRAWALYPHLGPFQTYFRKFMRLG
ncbi:MAG: DinB family protein [Planctomycetota bacterium]|nr:DinB family protein [Planctomycetota bacterium]